jgi:hypothetical protein
MHANHRYVTIPASTEYTGGSWSARSRRAPEAGSTSASPRRRLIGENHLSIYLPGKILQSDLGVHSHSDQTPPPTPVIRQSRGDASKWDLGTIYLRPRTAWGADWRSGLAQDLGRQLGPSRSLSVVGQLKGPAAELTVRF